MKNITNKLVEETKEYVSDLLENKLSVDVLFHSIKHTMDVLKNSETIAKYSCLEESDTNILRLSALFHDLGYIKMYQGHEEESAKYASEYLKSKDIDNSTIRNITGSILATKIPQCPKTIIAKMLCDADLMHLTYDNYFEQIDLMRLEWSNLGITNLNEQEFHLGSIDFFKAHKYFSEYGQDILEAKKQHTLLRIKKRIKDLRQ